MQDSVGNKVGVFKPSDEEPFAPNNPHGYLPFGKTTSNEEDAGQNSMRGGITPGEACHREVAAYLLDRDSNVHDVPMTTLVEGRHRAFNTNGSQLSLLLGGAGLGKHRFGESEEEGGGEKGEEPLKLGSFQQFVPSHSSMDDISHSLIPDAEGEQIMVGASWASKFATVKANNHKSPPPLTVMKIAILDIRIMNADRNAANLLVRQSPTTGEYQLIPIDHGYSLRSKADVTLFDWCWIDWPQIKLPLTVSERSERSELGWLKTN